MKLYQLTESITDINLIDRSEDQYLSKEPDDFDNKYGDTIIWDTYLITDDKNNKIKLITAYNNSNNIITIDWIGHQNKGIKLDIGYPTIKEIFKKLKEFYPKAEYIVGNRISGGRKGTLSNGNYKPFKINLKLL